MRPIHRILFIRTDRMGDVLMNLPALRVLRQTYPKAWLTLLVDTSVAGLFRSHPDLDELIAVDATALAQSFKKKWVLAHEIQKARFDLAVVSNADKFFHGLVFFSRIPVRVGWRRKCAFFLNRTLPDTKSSALRHEIDSNLDLIGLVSEKKWDGTICLAENEASAEKIRELLSRTKTALPIVAIHVGSSNVQKRWPQERFAEFCARLQNSKRCELILIGGLEEVPISQAISKKLPEPALDCTGCLSLEELVAFFKHPRVKTLISSDSGPVHVAWMSGKPVLSFYAKNVAGSDPARWAPRDNKSEVIFKPMSDISVEEVWERVQRLL